MADTVEAVLVMPAFTCGDNAPAGALRVLSRLTACCYGAAMRGPLGCTCWEPVYDLEQAEPPLLVLRKVVA